MDEIIGRDNLLRPGDTSQHWKAKHLDLRPILDTPKVPHGTPVRCVERQPDVLADQLDWELLKICKDAVEHQKRVQRSLPISNRNRAVGTLLQLLRDQEARRARPARGHHRLAVHGSRRPELRRVPDPGDHVASSGRCQRLPGQGALRWQADRCTSPGVAVRGYGKRDRGQRRDLWSDRRRGLSSGQGRRTVRRRNSGAKAVVEVWETMAANT